MYLSLCDHFIIYDDAVHSAYIVKTVLVIMSPVLFKCLVMFAK